MITLTPIVSSPVLWIAQGPGWIYDALRECGVGVTERQIMLALARVPFGLLGLGVAGFIMLAADTAGGNGMSAELPFSQGQGFEQLDAYLAHLERLGAMDITWYRLLPDGTYEMIRRRPPGTPPTILTRQELLDRYGFAR